MLKELIAPEYLVLIAGVFFTLGYLIINQVWLRLSLMVGTVFYVLYYATVADAPLWEAIWTSTVMGIANLIGLGSLLARNSRFAIPAAHRDIYPIFKSLPPGDFRKLIKIATRRQLSVDETVTQEGTAADRLIFVLSGSMRISKKSEAFDMPDGLFIGEVALVTFRNSVATTIVNKGAEILEWDFATLRKYSAKSQRFKLAVDAMITQDLAHKVAAGVAPHAQKELEINHIVHAERIAQMRRDANR